MKHFLGGCGAGMVLWLLDRRAPANFAAAAFYALAVGFATWGLWP